MKVCDAPSKLHVKRPREESSCANLPFSDIEQSLKLHPVVIRYFNSVQPEKVHRCLEQMLSEVTREQFENSDVVGSDMKHAIQCPGCGESVPSAEIACKLCGVCPRHVDIDYGDPYRSFTDAFGAVQRRSHWEQCERPKGPCCKELVLNVAAHLEYGAAIVDKSMCYLRRFADTQKAKREKGEEQGSGDDEEQDRAVSITEAAVAAAFVAATCPSILSTKSAVPEVERKGFECVCGTIYGSRRDVRLCQRRCGSKSSAPIASNSSMRLKTI